MAITYLTREHGLPSTQIHNLALDSNGRLWAATPGGLVSYDGSRCSILTPKDGLRTQGMRVVMADSSGLMYAGSDSGLDIVTPDFDVMSHLPADWAYGFVECVLCDDNNIYLGTSRGLLQKTGNSWASIDYNRLRTGLVVALCKSQNQSIWAATLAGAELSFLVNGEWQSPIESEWRDVGRVICMTPTVGEYVIIGGENGFAEINSNGQIVTRPIKFEKKAPVTALLYCDKTLWVAVANLLFSYVRKKGSWVQSNAITMKSSINSLLVDSINNLWIATNGNGVGKLSSLHQKIQRIDIPNARGVLAIKKGHRGDLLVVGDHTGTRLSVGTDFKTNAIAAIEQRQNWDIVEYKDGTLFVATANGLVRILPDGSDEIIGRSNEVLSNPIRCLLAHSDGLVVGTLGGCVLLTDTMSTRPLNAVDGRSLGYVYTLVEDQQRQIWAGTMGSGLWRKTAIGFERVTGLHMNAKGNVYAIDVRSDNTLAFIQDNGIFVKPPDEEARLLTRSDETIAGWSIRWGGDGSLWVGTVSGLAQYNSEDGHLIRRITALLGLSNWEFTSSRSLQIDGDFLYCGLNSGLVRVNATKFESLEPLPKVKLHRVVFGKANARQLNGVHHVIVGNWTLTVSVYAAWFLDEAGVRFRYRLLGFDDDWSEMRPDPDLRFNSLPVGDYHLEVQAYDSLVGFGPIANIFTLRVEHNFWMRHWLSAPLRGAKKAFEAGGGLFRNRQLHERAASLEKAVAERSADLEQTKKQLERAKLELRRQTMTDEVTRVGNRKYFDERLENAMSIAKTHAQPLSLLLVDIDYFKNYNDHHGMEKAEYCLSQVARKINAEINREDDVVARYGADEFAVILSSTNENLAMKIAERLRASVFALDINHGVASDSQRITVSIGVATCNPKTERHASSAMFNDRAQNALNHAMRQGRNCCVFDGYKTMNSEN